MREIAVVLVDGIYTLNLGQFEVDAEDTEKNIAWDIIDGVRRIVDEMTAKVREEFGDAE